MTVGVLSAHYPDVLRAFRRRSPADSSVGSSAPPGSHAPPPHLFQGHTATKRITVIRQAAGGPPTKVTRCLMRIRL